MPVFRLDKAIGMVQRVKASLNLNRSAVRDAAAAGERRKERVENRKKERQRRSEKKQKLRATKQDSRARGKR